MRLDRLTQRSQEAMQAAQEIARDRSHTQLEPEHLLLALLEQEESLVVTLINKSGADASQIRQLEIEREAVIQEKDEKQRLEPIEKQLAENPLAIDILEHKFQAGDVVLVDREDDHLVFTKKVGAVAAA